MAITTIGLTTASKNLQKDINKAIEQELRSRALKAFADVKLTTPVDTGQARNSWYIGYTETYNNQKTAPATSNVNLLVPKDKPNKIIVTNGTTYIEFLNNGHSQQAPIKFIEAAFRKYFDEVTVEITNG